MNRPAAKRVRFAPLPYASMLLSSTGLAPPQTIVSRNRWRAARNAAGMASIALAGGALISPALAQVCPSPAVVVNTQCTVPPGTTIAVTPAGAIGLNASGGLGQITGNGITVNLGAATTTGALAQSGSTIIFDGSTLNTTSVGAAATGQTGLRATGAGSTVTATGATISMRPASGNASSMTGASVDNGGLITLTNTSVLMGGGANGVGDHALVATGTGSQITMTGGAASAAARGSSGALAQDGGVIILNGGAQVSTTGAQTTGGSPVGSHALFATGGGSQITGTGITVSASGTLASATRAASGGTVSLTGSSVSTSGAGTTVDPTAGLRAVDGGIVRIDGGSTITTTGQFGHGVSIEGAGSQGFLTDTSVTVSGTRAMGVHALSGGAGTLVNSSVLVSNSIAALADGGTLDITDSTIRATAATAHAVRALAGSTITVTGGSITTEGRDAAALSAGSSTITANNVTIRTLGIDNAIGVLADGASLITVTGGSVETFGDAIRLASFPHAMAARNPGGTLVSTGTTLLTHGIKAMGAVADDGGSVTLTGNTIRTEGLQSIGLFSVVEQVGSQFPADITATGITVETSGITAHGALAQQNFLEAPATINLDTSAITTHGDGAVGLRAISAGTVNANSTTVLTEGISAHGMQARDNGSSVNLNQTSVLATGAAAHGALAESGGLVTGIDATVTATGAEASALYAAGAPGFVSAAIFTGSTLRNVSGPTIGVAGNATITLTGTTAGGSGQWLRVGTLNDFPPLAAPEPPLTGIEDADAPPIVSAPPPAALPVVPGLADILLTASTVTGSAFTAPGSVSNLTMQGGTLWTMTGNSNITNLTNDASLVDYTPPNGDPNLLASYKTLTVMNYIGVGGTLGLNTFLGDDTAPSDRLIVDGGAATGNSTLRITNTIGPGALTTGNGILVVDAINGGTTVPGAFRLGNIVAAGAYEYLLFRGGVTPGVEDDWFLRSQLLPPPPPPGPPPPPPPPVPLFRPEAALYASLPAVARASTLATLDTFHERQGEQFLLRGNTNISAAWGRVFGQHTDQRFEGPFQQEFNGTITGFQGGVDLLGWERGLHRDRAGLFAAFSQADMDVRGFAIAVPRAPAGSITLDSTSVGAYWTHIGPAAWYVDTVVMGTFFDSNARSIRGNFGINPDGTGITASVESGVPIWFGQSWTIEPQVQLIFQHVDFDDAADPFSRVFFHTDDAVTGRVGLRITNTFQWLGATIQPYLRANLWHQFTGTDVTQFNLASFGTPLEATSVEVGGGIVASVNAALGLFATASYVTDVSGVSQETVKGRIGMRYTW